MDFLHISKPIILASSSPRRRELMQKTVGSKVALKFFSPNVNEVVPIDTIPEKIAAFLSEHKMIKVLGKYPELKNNIIITADTIVLEKNKILGKPANKKEAVEFLKMLSGNTHKVISAYSIFDGEKIKTEEDVTEVKFVILEDDEINYYINNYKPFDKAGAYGIQEWIGLIGIESINGSFYTVMGLPTHKLFKELKKYFG